MKLKHQDLKDKLEICLLELKKLCIREAVSFVFWGTQFKKKHNADEAAFKIKRTQSVPTSESWGNFNNVASRLTQSQTVQMLLTQVNKLWQLDVSHDSAPVVRG